MKSIITFCRWLCVFTFLISAPAMFSAVPTITSLSPITGSPGTLVTITGANFGALPVNDTVYFGPVRATVMSATTNNLTVVVPNGAMYGSITVTVGGLVAYSVSPFETTFSGNGGGLNSSNFAPRVDFAVPSGPLRVSVADLNGDGKPDLVIGSVYANQITILENTNAGGSIGTNSFAAPIYFPFGNSGYDLYWLITGDVDGDGKIDIIAPDQAGNRILIYRNISSGGPLTTNSFAPPVAFAVGNTPRNIVLRDLDGDGRPDIAVANVGDQTISILRNTGVAGVIDTNTFAPQIKLPVGSQPQDLAAGDLDGDGKPDLAIGNYTSPFVSIYRNVSVPGALNTNSFAARVDLPALLHCNSLVMGDMDNDGKLDLLTGTAEGDNAVSVFRNISSPGSLSTNSFAPHVDFGGAGWVSTVTVGDLNGDGKLDVAMTSQMASTLSLFQNVGTGSFNSASLGSRVDLPSGLNPYGVSIVDLNGDGRPDLVFNNAYDASLSIYQNVLAFTAPPVISSQPISQTVVAGTNVSFSVIASGSPTLTYQWWKGTGMISGATSSTLSLTNVQSGNAGTYYVVVSNPGGSTTSASAVLIVTNQSNGSCTPPASGIAAWWPGEGNGNDIVNGNTAILESGVTFAPGKVGRAFQLQNPTNAFMHAPASASLNIGAGSGLTMEAWINVSSVDGLHPVAEWYGDARDKVACQLYLNSNPSQSGALFGVLVETNGTVHTLLSSSGTLSPNVFQHVAMTYDRASGTGTLYVNGSVVAQGAFGSFTPLTSYDLWIGHRPFDVPGDWTYGAYLGGLLDEFTLYNRALSSNEIAAIYNAGAAGKCSSTTTNTGPVITNQPTNQTVSVGGTATFSVTATGSPTLHYQWYGPGSVLIPGAVNSTLTLSNVQPTNAGAYFAFVTNLFGFAQSSNAVLTVNGGSTNGSCTPPASGIAAWWRGENNANDSVGTNNGSITGGITYTGGEVGQAFRFDGTSGYISVPASPTLNVGTGSGITIEGWIKPDHLGPNGAAGRPIVEYDTPNAIGVHMFFELGYDLYANVVDTSNVTHPIQSAPGTIVTNALQHVALTYDKSSGNCFLYINGVQAASANFGSITPQTSYPLSIGLRAANGFPGSGSLYNGLLDELSLYNRALSQSEIQAIYSADSAGKCTSATSNTPPVITKQPTNQTVSVGGTATFSVTATGSPTLHYQWYGPGSTLIPGAVNSTLTLSNVQPTNAGAYFAFVTNLFGFAQSSNAVLTVNGGSTNGSCTPPPSGLVAWWKAEGNALDSIGANNGTILGGLGYTNGEVGQAFNFVNNSQGVQVNASSSLAVKSITIEAWINPTDVSDFHPIVEYGADTGLDPVQFLYGWNDPAGTTPGALFGIFRDTNGGALVINSAGGILPAGQWSHVAMTFNITNQTGSLYLNGANVGSTVYTSGILVPQTSLPVHLGYRPDTSGEGRAGTRLSGGLDEVSIYNRALSLSEIQAISQAGAQGKCLNTQPLVITRQPSNVTVTAGSPAAFSVIASGTGTLGYQWYKGTGTVAGATNSILAFAHAQSGDAGTYHVVVSDAHTSVTSSNATLTVILPVTSVMVVNTNAPGGSSFDLPIILNANGTENGLSFTLNFDSTRLMYSGIAVGSGGGDAYLLPNTSQAASGKIGVQLALPSGETFPAGALEVIRVTFTSPILTSSQAVVTPVTFSSQPIAELVSDVFGHALPANFINGAVTLLPSTLEGDASPVPNGDRKVDLLDWVQVGRFVAGFDTITNGTEFQKVDCAPRNTLGDGHLKVTDWVQAGRYAAGLDPLTLAGGPTGPVAPVIANALPSSSSTRQLTVNGVSTVKGLTTTLPINLEAQGDETALAFSLNFDPTAIRYIGTTRGSADPTAILNVNSNQVASGQLAIVLCLPSVGSQFPAGTMEIANVTFEAIAATTNNSVGFADQPVLRSISDTNATELPANYIGNSVVINPQPTMGLSTAGGTSQLTWPAWAGDFTLQAAGSLTPPINWTNVPVTVQTNGDNIGVTLPVPDQQTFFRLYHP